MASRGQPVGHLIRKPRGFQIFRNNLSPWKYQIHSVYGSSGKKRGTANLLLSPNHPSRHLLLNPSPRLLSSLPPLFSLFPPHHLPPFFFSMATPESSNITAHGNGGNADLQTSAAPTKTVGVSIKGRVQGVFYRNWTIENAKELNLKGWVRNRRDGSVEALFSGEPGSVDRMVERCRRGPAAAVVTGLDVSVSTDDPGIDFERRHTV